MSDYWKNILLTSSNFLRKSLDQGLPRPLLSSSPHWVQQQGEPHYPWLGTSEELNFCDIDMWTDCFISLLMRKNETMIIKMAFSVLDWSCPFIDFRIVGRQIHLSEAKIETLCSFTRFSTIRSPSFTVWGPWIILHSTSVLSCYPTGPGISPSAWSLHYAAIYWNKRFQKLRKVKA